MNLLESVTAQSDIQVVARDEEDVGAAFGYGSSDRNKEKSYPREEHSTPAIQSTNKHSISVLDVESNGNP